MAGLSNRDYYNQVDEALVLYGGDSPCIDIDPRMWKEFKEIYQEHHNEQPKSNEWSFDKVSEYFKHLEENDQ